MVGELVIPEGRVPVNDSSLKTFFIENINVSIGVLFPPVGLALS